MRVIREKIEGKTVLSEDTELYGMIAGDTRVCENIVLKLHGMVIGKLILETNSVAYLHGMVVGDILNKGGHLEIFGTVNGRVLTENGKTLIDPKASIRNGVA